MKSISYRQFRGSMTTITEPVEVVIRRPGGDLERLGTWTPATVEIEVPGMARRSVTPVSIGFNPAPKPSVKGRAK